MRKESLRRHGVLDKVEGTSGYELFRDARAELKNQSEKTGSNKATPLGQVLQEDLKTSRTEVEGGLQDYKNAAKKMKQENS